jgi:hypothetical protein
MIYTQKFETMDSFFKFITTAHNNKVFADEHNSDRNCENFAGTKNFSEAAELFRNGWDAGLEKIKAGKGGDFASPAPRALVRNYYVGACPNVPRALQGLPDAMRQVYRQPQKQKVMTVFIDMCVSSMLDKDRYQKVGGYIYQAIKAIEEQGTRVEIITGFADSIGTNRRAAEELIICPEITLKKASETLDAGRLSFALVHVGMFRRLCFKYIETCPCELLNGSRARDYTPSGYGIVAMANEEIAAKVKKHMKKTHENAVVLYMSKLAQNREITSGEKLLELIKSELKGSAEK